jgi:hypothetical protein
MAKTEYNPSRKLLRQARISARLSQTDVASARKADPPRTP